MMITITITITILIDANGMPPIGNGTIPINSIVDINGSEVRLHY